MSNLTAFTVVLLVPCCEKSAPDYNPGPRPVWNRIPGGWPPRCLHANKRLLTITEHPTRASAEPEYAMTLGWFSLTGYLYEGVMPPEGERFRIMKVAGSLSFGYFQKEPGKLVFPTAEFAMEWAEKKRHSLYNIVGDTDTRVRLSSYGLPTGVELEPGCCA